MLPFFFFSSLLSLSPSRLSRSAASPSSLSPDFVGAIARVPRFRRATLGGALLFFGDAAPAAGWIRRPSIRQQQEEGLPGGPEAVRGGASGRGVQRAARWQEAGRLRQEQGGQAE